MPQILVSFYPCSLVREMHVLVHYTNNLHKEQLRAYTFTHTLTHKHARIESEFIRIDFWCVDDQLKVRNRCLLQQYLLLPHYD